MRMLPQIMETADPAATLARAAQGRARRRHRQRRSNARRSGNCARCRRRRSSYGTTAVASISICASGSNRRTTCTRAIAGKWRPSPRDRRRRARGGSRDTRPCRSRTRSCARYARAGAAFGQNRDDVAQRWRTWATKPFGNCPSASQPIMPPTKTNSPRADAVGVALGAGQPGGCRSRVFAARRACGGRFGPARASPHEASLRAAPSAARRAQHEALQLAGLRARQRGDELDRARIFVGRDRRLDEILQRPRHVGVAGRCPARSTRRP